MSAVKIGQRWRYRSGGLDFLVEVQAQRIDTVDGGSCQGIVLQGNYTPGSIHNFNPFPPTTEVGSTELGWFGWFYLQGQDKPEK